MDNWLSWSSSPDKKTKPIKLNFDKSLTDSKKNSVTWEFSKDQIIQYCIDDEQIDGWEVLLTCISLVNN